jgi:hypothetical protein
MSKSWCSVHEYDNHECRILQIPQIHSSNIRRDMVVDFTLLTEILHRIGVAIG